MATEQQIAANRANAQLSTGPRTDAGKAASSTNALRHGLASRGLIILPGQEPVFAQMESDLRHSLNPDGPLQELIFKRALTATWNLHRCGEAEALVYEKSGRPGLDPMLDNDNANEVRYARIRKYAREAENSMYKAMRELGKLQAEQQFRHEAFPLNDAQPENAEVHAKSEVCSMRQVLKNVANHSRNEAKPAAGSRIQANRDTRIHRAAA